MRTHMVAPKIKSCRSVGTNVKGIQNTASRRSLILKFKRNTLVTVLILLFCIRVNITSVLPTTDSKKIRLYNGILTAPPNCIGGDSLLKGVSIRLVRLDVAFWSSVKLYCQVSLDKSINPSCFSIMTELFFTNSF